MLTQGNLDQLYWWGCVFSACLASYAAGKGVYCLVQRWLYQRAENRAFAEYFRRFKGPRG